MARAHRASGMTDMVATAKLDDPVGHRPWLAVASVTAGAFVVITTEFLPIGLLGRIAADVHVSIGTAGLMVALPGIVAAIAAPAITLLANKVDRRLLLIGFAALVVLANGIIALAPGFAMILVGRVLLGISVGGFWTFAVAAGRRLVQEQYGGRATAIILSGISIGTVVGVPIGTALGAMAGWRFAFGSVAVLAGLTVLAQLLLLSRLPDSQAVSLHTLLGLFKIPAMSIGFLASALIAAGHFTAYTYLEPFLSHTVNLTASGISWTFAAYGTAGAIGTFAAERAAVRDLRSTFIGVALLMGLAIIMASVCGSSHAGAVAAVVVWGTAFGAVPVCTQIWTYRSAPEQFEPASAVGITIFQMALAAGSFVGGTVVDRSGIPPTFVLGGALSLTCGLLVLLVRRFPQIAENGSRGKLE